MRTRRRALHHHHGHSCHVDGSHNMQNSLKRLNGQSAFSLSQPINTCQAIIKGMSFPHLLCHPRTYFVIPAKAGIQENTTLDPRLRGDDEIKRGDDSLRRDDMY